MFKILWGGWGGESEKRRERSEGEKEGPGLSTVPIHAALLLRPWGEMGGGETCKVAEDLGCQAGCKASLTSSPVMQQFCKCVASFYLSKKNIAFCFDVWGNLSEVSNSHPPAPSLPAVCS